MFAAWIVTRFYSSKLYSSIATHTVSPDLRMRRLFCAFVVRIWHKTRFSWPAQMLIIKEPHNHEEDSGSVTVIKEVSQSWSEGSGSVFAPGLFELRRFGPGRFAPWLFRQDVSPPNIWTWTFNPLTFWTRTFRPLTLWTWTFRCLTIWTRKFRALTFWTWTFRAQDVSPPDLLDLDVSPPACPENKFQ